jgi:hypothetical protein
LTPLSAFASFLTALGKVIQAVKPAHVFTGAPINQRASHWALIKPFSGLSFIYVFNIYHGTLVRLNTRGGGDFKSTMARDFVNDYKLNKIQCQIQIQKMNQNHYGGQKKHNVII